MTTRTVAAVFDRYEDAAKAVGKLEAAGVAHSEISIVSNDAAQRDHYSTETDKTGDGDHTGAGAQTGASVGTALGAGAGLLAGLGLLAIPGLGPVVAAGWLASTLLGAGAGAATGGVIGSLAGAGIDKTHAHSYAEAVHRGGTLVTVRADAANHDQIVDILDDDGTVDMGKREATWRSEGWNGEYSGSSAGGVTGAISEATSSIGQAASRLGEKVADATSTDSRPPDASGIDRDSDVTTNRARARSYPL